MSNAPKVRGTFLTALNRPVLVCPSDAEATVVLDEATIPADVSLPAVVRLGEETYEVASPWSPVARRVSARKSPRALSTRAVSSSSPTSTATGPQPSARNSARTSPTPSS